MPTIRKLLVLGSVILFAGCPSGDATSGADAEGGPDGRPSVESMTRQQRDSVIGESRLPGAGVVRGAREASEAQRQRVEAHDTIRE